MVWKSNFAEGKEIVLATCSKNSVPNANIVVSLGFMDGRLMVADCSMNTTIKNLKENPKICIISGYYRLRGKVDLFSSGKYFEKCTEIVASQDKTLKVKTAIVIEVEEVFDLDKMKAVL